MNDHYGYAQVEGVMIVLQALFDLEIGDFDGTEISREYVIAKLNDLMLQDFTDAILNNYFPIKEKK